MLRCYNTFEMGKAKLVSFFFPSVSSVRGTGKNQNTRSRIDAVPCFHISQNLVLLQNTAHMQKLFRLSFTGLAIQHLHTDE